MNFDRQFDDFNVQVSDEIRFLRAVFWQFGEIFVMLRFHDL